MPGVNRLDVAIAERGLAKSRNAAQNLIKGGFVVVNGLQVIKSNQLVAETDIIDVNGSDCPYVSRGGIKLAAAIKRYSVAVQGKRCLDVGSSTGGFTDCLLQAGAARVTGLDVGHGQMDAAIASDPRVENREGVNARNITKSDFPSLFDIAVIDVSFISLTLVLKPISDVVESGGTVIALIKPQFEVGAEMLGKGGLVRRATDRASAVHRVEQHAVGACGLTLIGTFESPIEGGEGNVEYLSCYRAS
ncbi:MAG TPA: TlyA family RNA methyltransferase [Capsulimonadaceae bacterium]|jgi:23S rRNA (cytidine1920-2'-O)/16S rRNA (cytidine1409-2'-O)-methyltransferase